MAQHRVELARRSGDTGQLFSALITLGALCSNPIVTAPSREHLDTTLYVKQRQFYERHQRELVGVPQQEWVMPPPADMLRLAASAYGEAAEPSDGPTRGRCRKAQATSLLYLEQFADKSTGPRSRCSPGTQPRSSTARRHPATSSARMGSSPSWESRRRRTSWAGSCATAVTHSSPSRGRTARSRSR